MGITCSKTDFQGLSRLIESKRQFIQTVAFVEPIVGSSAIVHDIATNSHKIHTCFASTQRGFKIGASESNG